MEGKLDKMDKLCVCLEFKKEIGTFERSSKQIC